MVGIDLGGTGKCSYDSNLQIAKNNRDQIVRKSSLNLSDTDNLLYRFKEHQNIFLDVSSMDRRTLSLVIYRLLHSLELLSATIYFLYAPAKYREPTTEQLPVDYSGPMNSLLTSAPRDPRFPTILFLGVGYEVGLALGVVEMFEPARVLAFVPRGADKRFDHAVGRINAPLFMDQNYISDIPYNLLAPASTFIELKERVLSLRDSAKIIVVPLGPKIFASMGILLGYLFAPDITIWRISSVVDWLNAEREADGSILGYKLDIASPFSTATI